MYTILLLILIAIPAGLPVLRSDFFSIHDETHMVDLYEMFRAFGTQGFPPRWAPDFNFGLGHPYFNFYYHLPFYITSFLIFLGFSMISSFKIYLMITIFSAIIGFYFFIRNHFSKQAALVAATLYLYTPYFAVDLYVRGAVGELAVFAILPWVAFGLNRLSVKPTLFIYIVTSFLIALLAVAHNVLNIFAFPLLFSYGAVLAIFSKKKLRKKIISLVLTFALGIGLASYYILPALFEKQFISNYEQIKIEDQFPFIKQLIIPHWGYGTSHWGPDDDISFQIGIINLIAVILAISLLVKRRTTDALSIFFLIVFLTSVVLMNSRTLFFWNLHPILRNFQFPWRMLLFTTFSTSFLLAFAADKKRVFGYTAFGIVVILILNVWYFRPSEYKQITDERYLELYFANRTLAGDGEREYLSREYLNFSEDFIPLTKWQKIRANMLPEALVEPEKNAQLSYKKEGINYQINISSKENNNLKVYTTYFPGWTAKVDGQNTNVFPATDLGIISFNVPKGEHKVSLSFENTFIRNFANLLSLSSALLLFLLLIIHLVTVRKSS